MRKTRTSEFHPAKLISIVSFPITRSNVKYPQRPLALELARSFVDRGSVPDRCKTTVRPDWLLHDGWHYSNSPWRSVPISTRSLCSVASMVFPPITRPSRGNHFEAPWRFSAPRARRIRFLRGVSRGHAQGWMSKEKTIDLQRRIRNWENTARDGTRNGKAERGCRRGWGGHAGTRWDAHGLQSTSRILLKVNTGIQFQVRAGVSSCSKCA